MERGYISDWHSALFYSELSWIMKIVRSIIPDIESTEVMKGIGRIAFIFIAFSVHYIVYELIKQNRFYLILLALFIVSLAIFNVMLAKDFFCNLSYFFLALLAGIFPLCKLLKSPRTLCKLLGIVGVIIICVHIVEFRRNAWLILPFIMVFLTRIMGVFCWKKQLVSILIVLLTVSGIDYLVNRMIKPREMHSASVMLVSDTKIASILCNQRESEKLWLMEHCSVKSPSRTEVKLRANSDIDPIAESQYDVIRRVALTDTQWEDLKEHYVQYWKLFPREMLYARLLSVVHLFWSVKTPEWLQMHLKKAYPHLSDDNFAEPDGCVWENVLPPEITLTLWSSVLLLTIGLGYYTKKKNGSVCLLDGGLIMSCIVGFVYIASHLVIVPAPFIRYFAPANFVFVMLIPLIVLRLINIYIDTKRELA